MEPSHQIPPSPPTFQSPLAFIELVEIVVVKDCNGDESEIQVEWEKLWFFLFIETSKSKNKGKMGL